jgi:hypothetical protein
LGLVAELARPGVSLPIYYTIVLFSNDRLTTIIGDKSLKFGTIWAALGAKSGIKLEELLPPVGCRTAPGAILRAA